jgi:hypothetical protein
MSADLVKCIATAIAHVAGQGFNQLATTKAHKIAEPTAGLELRNGAMMRVAAQPRDLIDPPSARPRYRDE